MSTAMTSAPSAANRTASARPCPRAAPVMNTTWPSNRRARGSAGTRAGGIGAVTRHHPNGQLYWLTDYTHVSTRLVEPSRGAHLGKLDGKVAVVTGAARGQGRSRAVT